MTRFRPGFGWGLFALGMALYLTVPAALLNQWGIPYDSPGGSVLVKFHLGTYVLVLALLVLCAQGGNPVRGLVQALLDEPWLGLHLASTLLLLGYTIFRHGASGSAFVIESLLMAPLCALAVSRMDHGERRAMFVMVATALVLNSVLAIGEVLLRERLVPFTVSGVAIKDEYFRATALQGHPLENTIATAMMAVMVLELRLPVPVRALLATVLLMGLLAFGSRTGFMATALVLALIVVAVIGAGLARGRYGYGRIMGGGAAMMLMLAAGIGLVAALGLGERIFALMMWDDSADVRLRVWTVFDYLTTGDMVFGVSPADIDDIIYRLGLKYPQETIENFWLLMLMQFGIVGMVPFLGGLLAGCTFLWRWSNAPGRLALLLFLLVASSNNSLAAKCHSLPVLYTALAAAGTHSRRSLIPASPGSPICPSPGGRIRALGRGLNGRQMPANES